DLDVLDQLGERLRALGVDDGLLVLGCRPLGMPGHETESYPASSIVRIALVVGTMPLSRSGVSTRSRRSASMSPRASTSERIDSPVASASCARSAATWYPMYGVSAV